MYQCNTYVTRYRFANKNYKKYLKCDLFEEKNVKYIPYFGFLNALPPLAQSERRVCMALISKRFFTL